MRSPSRVPPSSLLSPRRRLSRSASVQLKWISARCLKSLCTSSTLYRARRQQANTAHLHRKGTAVASCEARAPMAARPQHCESRQEPRQGVAEGYRSGCNGVVQQSAVRRLPRLCVAARLLVAPHPLLQHALELARQALMRVHHCSRRKQTCQLHAFHASSSF